MLSVRIVVWVSAVSAAIAWFLVWLRCPLRQRGRAVLVFTWAVHTAVFTVAAQFRWLPPEVLNLWSSITRVHGLWAALVLAVDLYTDRNCDA